MNTGFTLSCLLWFTYHSKYYNTLKTADNKAKQSTVEPPSTDTSLLRTVSNVPTKFSYIFLIIKKPQSIIPTLSNVENGH